VARTGASVENTWGERRKRAVFFSLCRRKRVGEKNQPLFVSPLPSSNKNGPLFFTHLDGRGAVPLAWERREKAAAAGLGGSRRDNSPHLLRSLSSLQSLSLYSLSIRTVSLSLLSPLLYSFFPEFSLCSTIWFFLVFVGGVDITPVFFFFFAGFFPPFWEVVFEND
jgi:hypothetical protein